MYKLDDNLLNELGLGNLPPDEKTEVLARIYKTIQTRTSMKLTEKMTDEQLEEFESFIDQDDEDGALKWLEANFPAYKQIAADELDALKNEIKGATDRVVDAVHRERADQ